MTSMAFPWKLSNHLKRNIPADQSHHHNPSMPSGPFGLAGCYRASWQYCSRAAAHHPVRFGNKFYIFPRHRNPESGTPVALDH
jgi:hypothetical protein